MRQAVAEVVPRIYHSQYFLPPFWSSCFPSFRKHAVLSQFRPARSRGSQPFVSKSCACLLRELAVIVSKETHCFRVVSNLDNTTKDTLEKEIANDDIVVSKLDIMATPKIVFVQDKPLSLLITSMLMVTINLSMSKIMK